MTKKTIQQQQTPIMENSTISIIVNASRIKLIFFKLLYLVFFYFVKIVEEIWCIVFSKQLNLEIRKEAFFVTKKMLQVFLFFYGADFF